MPAVGADGVGCVIERCIGCAVMGAVPVVGGAEKVWLPRLPMELLDPARASARPGAKAIAKAGRTAITNFVRFMMPVIFCWVGFSEPALLSRTRYGVPARRKPGGR